MLELVNINEMEQKLRQQYRDASNISARINLHRDFSMNPVSGLAGCLMSVTFLRGKRCSRWAAVMPLSGHRT